MNAGSTFRCYLAERDPEGSVSGGIVSRSVDDLPAGEVLIRVEWSSLNFKDGLSAVGRPGVTRYYPHVPGIDAAGVVVESRSPTLLPGAEVVVTGFDLGQNTWGGFAELIRVPAAWVLPRPEGLSLRETMILGTAGLTAGLAVDALSRHPVRPDDGEIVVTGASGGVGSLAVAVLARAGYRPVAVTGKPAAAEWLRGLGAVAVLAREDVLDGSSKPLLPARWAGAIDTVGGATLTSLLRATARAGCVLACGLVGGVDLRLTVFPFILRGVALCGIASAETSWELRARAWQRLAGEWKPSDLEGLCTEVPLDELAPWFPRILDGQVRGRVLVRVK